MSKYLKKTLFTILILVMPYMHSVSKAMDDSYNDDFKKTNITHKIPVGSVLAFAGTTEPSGWLMCYGQIVSRFQYQDLYNVIGRTYPVPTIGNQAPLSEDLFCVPDMRGRVPVGTDSNSGRTDFVSSNRVTSNNTLGAIGGEENVTLAVNQMPIHDHNFQTIGSDHAAIAQHGNSYGIPHHGAPPINGITTPAGGNQPHNNMQPYLILNYIIKY